MSHKVYYVMGVSGSGKTSFGNLLADELMCPFFDGDDFHSEHNVAKMKSGNALTDEDRHDWLVRLNKLAQEEIVHHSLVIACSALKESYRTTLMHQLENLCTFIYLKGDYETIHSRMKNREGHYMPEALLQSQFDTLEEPAYGVYLDISLPMKENINYLMQQLLR